MTTNGDVFAGLPECVRQVNGWADALVAALHNDFPTFDPPKTRREARKLDDAGAAWVKAVCGAALNLAGAFRIERDVTNFTSFAVFTATSPPSVLVGGPTKTSRYMHHFSLGGAELAGDVLGFPPGMDTVFNVRAIASDKDLHAFGFETADDIALAFEDHLKTPTLADALGKRALAIQLRGLPHYDTNQVTGEQMPEPLWPAIAKGRRTRCLAVRMACLRAVAWIRHETARLRADTLPQIVLHDDRTATITLAGDKHKTAKLPKGVCKYIHALATTGKVSIGSDRKRTFAVRKRLPELGSLLNAGSPTNGWVSVSEDVRKGLNTAEWYQSEEKRKREMERQK